MRLPFTEQFLWDIYSIGESFSDIDRAIRPRGWREALNPELQRLRRRYEKKRSSRQFNQLVYYLKKKGWVRVQGEGVMLTPKGREQALRITWKLAAPQRRTDGKMVLVMYDFPEKKRSLRDLFRDILTRRFGYQELQLSVFVSKKKVERETEEVIRAYNLWRYVRLFVIQEIHV